MRFRFALVSLVLLCFSCLPAFAQQGWGRPHPPAGGACFYRDAGFNGDYFCLKDGERWPSLPPGFNDRISSIRVFGGARLRVFNDADFGGISAMIDHDVDDLSIFRLPENPFKSWNDRISSIAVFRERDEWERHGQDQGRQPYEGQASGQGQGPYQGQAPNQGPPPGDGRESRQDFPRVGACFYADEDYRGEYFCMKDGERAPVVPPGFNDRISSIRVFGGARVRVFGDGNFGGSNLAIDHDARNLREIPLADAPFKNWNDRISSIALGRERGDGDRRDRHEHRPR